MKWMKLTTVFLAMLLLAGGCVQNYRVTQPLEQPLNQNAHCEIGAIADALPQDYEEEDKPSSAFVAKLRGSLVKEVMELEVFASIGENNAEADYEISRSILDYKKGSGFLRFLIGFGAGSSKLTVELSLTDRTSGSVIFSGNFSQSVSSWAEESDATCEKLAKDFAKAVKKQLKALEKEG